MPFSPEYLPETILLFSGILAGAFAIHLFITRQRARAARVGAVSFVCIAVAVAFGKADCMHSRYAEQWRTWRPRTSPLALLPAASDSTPRDSAPVPTTVLVLGGVTVEVVASDRHVLALGEEPFLTLDSLATGLLVTCTVAGRDSGPMARGHSVAAEIARNRVVRRGPHVRSRRLDPHTIVVHQEEEEIFRVHHASARTVEVAGRFDVPAAEPPTLVSFRDGIHWPGGSIPLGASVDLRPQGEGTLRFERSGLIQMVRE